MNLIDLMKNENLVRRAYVCPSALLAEVDFAKGFAMSNVTLILESNVEVDEWGSVNNEVSFD